MNFARLAMNSPYLWNIIGVPFLAEQVLLLTSCWAIHLSDVANVRFDCNPCGGMTPRSERAMLTDRLPFRPIAARRRDSVPSNGCSGPDNLDVG